MELLGLAACHRPYELALVGGNLALHPDIKCGGIEETDEEPSQMDL